MHFKSILTILLLSFLLSASTRAQNISINGSAITFPDGSTQSTAGEAIVPREVHVRAEIDDPIASGTTLTNVVTFLNAFGNVSADFPYLLILGPGTFDIGAAQLTLPQYFSLRGAGIDVSTIQGAPTTSPQAVLLTSGNGVVSNLTVKYQGTTGMNGRAIVTGGDGMRFNHVRALVTGTFSSGATLTVLSTAGGTNTTLTDCAIEIDSSTTCSTCLTAGIAVSASPSNLTADGIQISINPASTPHTSYGLYASGSDIIALTNVTIFAKLGSNTTGAVRAISTTLLHIRNSIIETTSGSNFGVYGDATTPIRILNSQILGNRTGGNDLYRNCVDSGYNTI